MSANLFKKIKNVNTNKLTSVARNMDSLKAKANGHDERGPSPAFAKCSLDVPRGVSAETQASSQDSRCGQCAGIAGGGAMRVRTAFRWSVFCSVLGTEHPFNMSLFFF